MTSNATGAPSDTRTTGSSARISVIMPVYNGAEFILQSLPRLIDMQSRGEVLEVIVVDDGSTDGSKEMAQNMGAKVLSSGGRLGPGGARNQAAHVAHGDILWFVDADVVVHSDAAIRLADGFDVEQVVAVFGSYDNNPPARNFFSRYKNLVHHYYHNRAKDEAHTFWSGCGGVRRAAFLSCGGFDVERYQYPSIEDIELGHRLIKSGGRIRLMRDVQCTHLKVWRFWNLIHTEIFRRAIPWSRLIVDAGEGIPNDLNVSVAEQGRAVLAGVLLLALGAWLVGYVSVVWVLVLGLVVLLANRDMVVFFNRAGGFLFTVRAIFFHQIYYVYSAVAFAWVVLEKKVLSLLPSKSR
ncbi:MAG: glycosyltransferase [Halioglobus sp.]|nr:glycosyltransferase [Halioglobus sp.]